MGVYWSSQEPPQPRQELQNDTGQNEDGDMLDPTARKAKREADLAKLKEDLARQRELRLKKLNQVSDEMRSLREELARERAKREEVEKQMEAMTGVISRDADMESDLTKGSIDSGSLTFQQNGIGKTSSRGDANNPAASDREGTCVVAPSTAINEETIAFNEVNVGTFVTHADSTGQEEDTEFGLKENIETSGVLPVEKTGSGKETNSARDKELEEMKEVVKDMFEKNKRLESQVKALKDVTNIGKELLKIREIQVSELNNKLKTIEETGVEYEKEVATMRKLKGLYEERARASEAEHKVELEREKARTTVFQVKLRLSEENNAELTDKIKILENKVAALDSQVDQLTEKLSESRVEAATKSEQLYHATSQMNLVNNLFSQVISGPEVDLDRLAVFLEENHNLINEITTKGDLNNVATLAGLTGGVEECPPSEQQNKIATNLGKVWRILVELLSHQTKAPNSQEWESCYKSVETPKGPKVVISVSRTFIKLKDLILEKNSLVKEVSRLKKLNHHLENKMEEQENRLTIVTAELHNTWGVVNKLRTQHENLHTHEKILRYELQHKRMMLNDLKKQLEVCREQWAKAKEKNSQTEKDWKQLRAEFAQRKRQQHGSAESGYEDEQSPDETDEEKSFEDDKGQGKLSDEEDLTHTWNGSENDETRQTISERDEANIVTPTVIEENLNQELISNHVMPQQTGSDLLPEESSNPSPETFPTSVQEPKAPVDIWKMLEKREERLKRMEGQTRVVLDQMSNTSQRGEAIGNKLNELHQAYGSCSDSLGQGSELAEERLKEEPIDSNSGCLQPEVVEDTSVRLIRPSSSEHQSHDEPNHPPPDRPSSSKTSFSMEEHLRRREERLQRMEESCKSLFAKMGHTSERSDEIANKLDEIHAQHSLQEDESTTHTNKESDQESS